MRSKTLRMISSSSEEIICCAAAARTWSVAYFPLILRVCFSYEWEQPLDYPTSAASTTWVPVLAERKAQARTYVHTHTSTHTQDIQYIQHDLGPLRVGVPEHCSRNTTVKNGTNIVLRNPQITQHAWKHVIPVRQPTPEATRVEDKQGTRDKNSHIIYRLLEKPARPGYKTQPLPTSICCPAAAAAGPDDNSDREALPLGTSVAIEAA